MQKAFQRHHTTVKRTEKKIHTTYRKRIFPDIFLDFYTTADREKTFLQQQREKTFSRIQQ
jgi:hypothetical protein